MFDTTTVWAFVQKHDKHLSRYLLLALVFVAGWQVGHIMSPYYSSQPIVFEEGANAASGGAAQELQALQEAGISARPPLTDGAVAGTAAQGQGEFVASVNSTLYHHTSCSTAARIKPENQVWFASAAEARSAGYAPSSCTQKLGL